MKKSDSNFEFSTTENVLLSPWRVSLETSLRMFWFCSFSEFSFCLVSFDPILILWEIEREMRNSFKLVIKLVQIGFEACNGLNRFNCS